MTESLSKIHLYLEAVTERPGDPSTDVVRRWISNLKAVAATAGNESEAKALWSLEETLEAQDRYLDAFAALKSHDFYRAWCSLERAEVALHSLEPHEAEPPHRFRTDFIRRYVPKWQSLFPYKLFLSPEVIQHEKKCSICGAVVRPRTPCGHRPGEIYRGELCMRVVTKAEPLGVGIVENPVQKYSVIFLNDPTTGKAYDHYNYATVRYAADRLRRPFDEWEVEKTTRTWPHSRFRHVGRNDSCPCSSKSKYKKCCLRKDGVTLPHMQFTFATPPPIDLPTEVYS
jgi:SEC-C motif